jgi:hypothetical protein
MSNNIPKIQWTEKTVHLAQLRPLESNPRKITEDQFTKLKASLVRYGQFKPWPVTMDFKMAGGHQRLRAMRELGWETCRVSVPDVVLSDEEFRDIVLRDNVNNGVWDMDVLANEWDLEELRTAGLHEVMNMPPFELGGEEEGKPKGQKVKCPGCGEVFATKGNKVDG